MQKEIRRAFGSQALRRVRGLVKTQEKRWKKSVQETMANRQITIQEQNMMAREQQWGECTLTLGPDTIKREQTGLIAFTVGSRNDSFTLRPQINMTDIDYAYQIIQQYSDIFEKEEENNEEQMQQYLNDNQKDILVFLQARQNVFGKIDVQGLNQEDKLLYLQKKLNMVMNYSDKDFNSVLKNK